MMENPLISDMPLVSVIIPVYNAERFVEQAIRSIMEQTYKNLEIIVCDDRSTDGTYRILEKLANEDKRIVLLRNERNLQIVATLNKMIEIAKGKYIARMDADDISLPTRIEKQVDFLEDNPDYGICGTFSKYIDENNCIIGNSRVPHKNKDIQIFVNFDSPFIHPSIMAKFFILKQNAYNIQYQYCEDFELWQRILKNTKGYNIKCNLLYYRILKTSISHQSRSSKIQKRIRWDLLSKSNFNEIYKIEDIMAASFLYIQAIKEKRIRFNLSKVQNIFYILAFIFYKAKNFMRFRCKKI